MKCDTSTKTLQIWVRGMVAVGGALLAVVAIIAILPTAAQAQSLLPFDPASDIAGQYGGWKDTAQGFARNIYVFLMVFEMIALAITTLLFRENLGEFFASVGFKILMFGVFMWFITYGPDVAHEVISWFSGIGQNQFGGGADSPYVLIPGFLEIVNILFGAASNAHNQQQELLGLLSVPPNCLWFYGGFGSCDVAAITAASNNHALFIMVTQGVALMILMATVGIVLQFSIVTIESYLVMSVGVLFIGFAGSRWTFSFSQGFFSYMINVGVKLMVTYIMLGVAAHELLPIFITAGAAAVTASFSPIDSLDAVPLILISMAAVYVVLTAGLLWTIPAFTAALLTGQSQSSGFSILSQATSSFAASAQLFSQLGGASKAGGGHQSAGTNNQTQGNHGNHSDAAGGGGNHEAGGSTTPIMAPASISDPFARASSNQPAVGSSAPTLAGFAPSRAAPSGGAFDGIGSRIASAQVQLPFGGANAANRPSRMELANAGSPSMDPRTNLPLAPQYAPALGDGVSRAKPLEEMSPQQIRDLSSDDFKNSFGNTNFKNMTQQQQQATNDSHSADVRDVLSERAARTQGDQEKSRGYALAYLSQAAQAQREIGQPSAVQVRLSNPDKL